MRRRQGWNVALVYFGVFLGLVAFWIILILGGWVVLR